MLVILSIVPLFMFVGKNFLPADDQSQFNVLVRTPEGTSLAATTNHRRAHRAGYPRNCPASQHTLMTAGGGADRSVNNATIYVKLTDIDQRKLSQQQLMQRTRELLKQYPPEIHSGVELVNASRRQSEQRRHSVLHSGPGSRQAGEILRPAAGEDEDDPQAGRHRYHAAQRQAGGARSRSIAPRAADLGVSVMDIEQALNTLVAGQVASTFNAGDDQYDVRVRAQEQFRGSVEGLAQMTVPSTKRGSRRAR